MKKKENEKITCENCGKKKKKRKMRGTTCFKCRIKLGYNP